MNGAATRLYAIPEGVKNTPLDIKPLYNPSVDMLSLTDDRAAASFVAIGSPARYRVRSLGGTILSGVIFQAVYPAL